MKTKRLRPDERAEHPRPMILTPRDREILKALSRCRVLTQTQLQTLFFGSKTATQIALRRLYNHQLVRRDFLPVAMMGRSPTFYLLDKRGAEILRQEGLEVPENYYRDQLTSEFIEHTSAISEFYLAVYQGSQDLGFTLSRWLGEGEIKANLADRVEAVVRGKRVKIPVIPDAFFTLRMPGFEYNFFVEIDRAKMTTKRFKTKMLGYIAYITSNHYQQRYQVDGIRVLTVAIGAKHVQNLKAVTEEAGGKNRFWFAEAKQVNKNTVFTAPIWYVAGKDAPTCLIDRPPNEPSQ